MFCLLKCIRVLPFCVLKCTLASGGGALGLCWSWRPTGPPGSARGRSQEGGIHRTQACMQQGRPNEQTFHSTTGLTPPLGNCLPALPAATGRDRRESLWSPQSALYFQTIHFLITRPKQDTAECSPSPSPACLGWKHETGRQEVSAPLSEMQGPELSHGVRAAV